MKSILNCLIITSVALALGGCSQSSNTGELYVSPSKTYREHRPLGMISIPGGSFMMGPDDQNLFFISTKQNKQVSVEPFWMDETEITNAEYRLFVDWVRDHIVRLGIFQNQVGLVSDEIAQMDKEGNILFLDEENDIPYLDYDEKIDTRDPEVKEFLDTFLYSSNSYEGQVLKVNKLLYSYAELDLVQAAKHVNRFDPVTARYNTQNRTEKDLIRKDTTYMRGGIIVRDTKYVQLTDRRDFFSTRTINIYPDTLCWMRNYTYSFNEPYTLYFSHPGYSDYPVVGVSWEQAKAFCHWRTKIRNDYLKSSGQPTIQPYRLPTEAEWEYAARGGKQSAMFPWGGPYIRRADGCYLANFKPNRGNYGADGYTTLAQVADFPANGYGLFDMAGNAAEWTESAYTNSTLMVVNDLNPTFTYYAKNDDPDILKKKVVKGGSWKDIGAFLQCGTQTSEHQEATLPYVGFRCVRTIINP